MTIDLEKLKADQILLESGYGPIEDFCAEHSDVLALIEVAEAAQAFLAAPMIGVLTPAQSTPVEWHRTRHNLEHALAKFKEPT